LYRRETDGFIQARNRMIDEIRRTGISSGRVLEAMRKVPRHLFVSEALRYRAYDDRPLPIGFNQTITKPSTVAKMVQSLGINGSERVLEIGTGSGYQASVLAELASSLVTIERIEELHKRAVDILLLDLNYKNIKLIRTANFHNAEGLFDAIIVSACTDIVPDELLDKLNDNGVLISPVADRAGQKLKRLQKTGGKIVVDEEYGEALFVPLILDGDATVLCPQK
jgi:protein-L-isoaspartate(D-aspartate) O-methyltransferase